MGGAVSAGADNDELIDNLLEADYIKTAVVERVFRAVDRGHYFTREFKERAYRDIAWKCGNLHISAPCIYSKVMENLKLAPGMSFLNLGSGTGYLSTMAGLILGPYGINHGIEIHEDVLKYATMKLEEFVLTSSAMDEYEFCEPKFVCGNCLHLDSAARQYDRVYCSAGCPENRESYMKNLIKVGGILVIPINDQLLQICRTSDTNWESKSVLPVTFASLISEENADFIEPLKMPDTDPLSLQDICRFVVRSILRRNIDIEHPELKKLPRVPKKKVKKLNLGRLLMPIFQNDSDDEDILNLESDKSIGCGRIYETPTFSVAAIEARLISQNFIEGTPSLDQRNAMEEDSNFGVESGSSSENIFDEMSESDFEEVQNMLAISETSTSTVTSFSDSEGVRQNLPSEAKVSAVKEESENKIKQKQKVDSGIVEDIKNDGGKVSDSDQDEDDENKGNSKNQFPFLKVTDSDTDTESYETTLKTKPERKKSNEISFSELMTSKDSPVDSPVSPLPPCNIITYTTYMKEKIELLPLPMTLKQYLNLNRKF